MSTIMSGRVDVIAGGYPPGALGGHDMDYARLRLLGLLATVRNDFSDIHRWLPGTQIRNSMGQLCGRGRTWRSRYGKCSRLL